MLRQALRENIAIEYRLAASACPIAADPGRIEEILLNLALNAQDAIPREGRLEIATTEVTPRGSFRAAPRRLPAGALRPALRERHGRRHGRGDGREDLRPVLHHQGSGKGHRARACPRCTASSSSTRGSIEVESRPAPGHSSRSTSRGARRGGRGTCPPRCGTPGPREARRSSSWKTRRPSARCCPGTCADWDTRCWRRTDGVSALRVSAEHEGQRAPPRHGRRHAADERDRPAATGCGRRCPALKVLFMSGYPRDVISSHLGQEDMDLIDEAIHGPGPRDRECGEIAGSLLVRARGEACGRGIDELRPEGLLVAAAGSERESVRAGNRRNTRGGRAPHRAPGG